MRVSTAKLVEVAEVSLPVAFLLEQYEAEGIAIYEHGFYDTEVDDFGIFFVGSTPIDTMYEQLMRAGASVSRRAGDLIVWFRKYR